MLKPEHVFSSLPTHIDKIFIAYSGGEDSHVLLHLIALNPDLKPKTIAVYINHGLQVEADDWQKHCQATALALGVTFKAIKVSINNAVSGKSLEELARDARYQALKPLLKENDVVLLAQHREDQMETVLLQLFRGAGVQGLSGMPQLISFGKGHMCRPLLDISKQDIKGYAKLNNLSWVEDPSNNSNDFDRNFLRNQIVPELKKKWPVIDKTVARSARHCANAYHLTEELTVELLNQIINQPDQTLNIAKFLEHDPRVQNLALRQWFKINQLRMPSEKVVHSIINEVIHASESRNPEIRGGDYSIRRYRNKLFCLTPTSTNQSNAELAWLPGSKQIVLQDSSKLIISDCKQGIPQEIWDAAEIVIKFRQGTEKIKLPGREGRHTLKKLYQEKGIPPWERNSIPLIYLNNQLAAIANLWISAGFFIDQQQSCYQIDWEKR